jgi:hypothetical protein
VQRCLQQRACSDNSVDSLPERQVRFTEQFFNRLEWLLPGERAADGMPSITDFLLFDLPRVRDRLRNWVAREKVDRGLVPGQTSDVIAEMKMLRREVADQQRTIEILKAVTGFFVREATPWQNRRLL